MNASLLEIAYRLNQALTIRRMRRSVESRKRVVHMPPLDAVSIHHLRMPSLVLDTGEAVIDAIMKHEVFTLNGDRKTPERYESAWNSFFFDAIPLERGGPDIRMVWEPARLQHLTSLLVYAHQKPDCPIIDSIKSFAQAALMDWIEKNPFLNGPHYMSPMECGLRMPVFFYALKVLDRLTPAERQEILGTLYLHAWWVAHNLSLYSSRGNHTVCECIGLVFAGAVFESYEIGREWLETGVRILKEEARRQILDDGGPIEQSLTYHRFVLDLYWLAVNFLECNGLADFGAVKGRLKKGEAFLDHFEDGSGSLPRIGDSDDGCAVAPGIDPIRASVSSDT